MTLHIYREVSTGTYAQYQVYGSEDQIPISTIHDGVLGEVKEQKLYVRGDTANEYYTNITVYPESLVSPSKIDGVSTGWGVKLKAVSQQPTEAEWDAVDFGNTVSVSNIGSASGGDINTYSPFWFRIECPAGAPADVQESIVLSISYTANAV